MVEHLMLERLLTSKGAVLAPDYNLRFTSSAILFHPGLSDAEP
ncbi:MAG TPA: hypothetical protein V6D43_09370 [Candidatus Sericytochromatia bacterium]